METAPLKSFATWARTALIREVTARIAVVLAPASHERVEQPNAVEALEKAVSAAGGADKGKASVADKVAYTWFNRIIALRFMDANGYTATGVVSPQVGVDSGQPEILAEAKRGIIDTTVVGTKTSETVTGLLNGSRRSEDPQGEAYALLLADCCRYWHRAMPFIFEREGDFTELLIPANLLADDSVLNRAVKVLSTDVCEDVEVIGWLYQFYISERKDEVFAGFKQNKKAGAGEIPAATQLFTPHWIVRYLVENSLGRLWMLNRLSSHLVDEMEYYIAPVDEETDFVKVSSPEELKVIDPACGSGHMLTYAFELLYAIYEEEGYAPSEIPRLILAKNLYGAEIDPRAGALAALALTMKARSRHRTFFSTPVFPQICVMEPASFDDAELDVLVTRDGDRKVEEAFWTAFTDSDSLGSLIRPAQELTDRMTEHLTTVLNENEADLVLSATLERAQRVLRQSGYLLPRYHILVTNPPYMGSKNMDSILVAFARREYPDAKSDLMTMFMRRAHELTLPCGYWAMINLPSWMFLTTFSAFRRWLLGESWLQSFVHLGRGVFGSDFGSVAFVCKRSRVDLGRSGVYRRLFEQHVEVRPNEQIRKLFLDKSYNRYEVAQTAFTSLPGEPIAYWLPDEGIRAYAEFDSLGEHSYGQPGLQTSDNARFIRLWFEVDATHINLSAESSEAARASGVRWFPLVKGGDFRKWFGNLEHVVDWEHDGARIKTSINEKYPYLNGNIDYVVKDRGYFFRPSLTYNKITSGRFTARFTPAGTIFDVAGSAVFPNDEPLLALAFLGSTTGEFFIRAQNPTLNVQSGDLARLPYPEGALKERASFLLSGVAEAIKISERDWDSAETAWGFTTSPLLQSGLESGRLAQRVAELLNAHRADRSELAHIETAINTAVAAAYRLDGHVPTGVEPAEVTLRTVDVATAVNDLVSFAVGTMFGRYSLDETGLILANQGDTLEDYLARVPAPSFTPDSDNVIPIVNGDWFEDDVVARFRTFLRVAFGEECFEENLRFVAESLGVRDIRDYFVKSFYKDHVQRYKKRPIYWLFSSANGSFNALIYMHRYTASTVSTVLNEYLREFRAKLTSSLQQQERLAAGGGTPRQRAAAQKEADRLRKVLLELEEYEHDVLYPLASRQLSIDLDDGVKTNYPKFGAALKKIPGLEASDE